MLARADRPLGISCGARPSEPLESKRLTLAVGGAADRDVARVDVTEARNTRTQNCAGVSDRCARRSVCRAACPSPPGSKAPVVASTASTGGLPPTFQKAPLLQEGAASPSRMQKATAEQLRGDDLAQRQKKVFGESAAKHVEGEGGGIRRYGGRPRLLVRVAARKRLAAPCSQDNGGLATIATPPFSRLFHISVSSARLIAGYSPSGGARRLWTW
jgi:hypothetical protein